MTKRIVHGLLGNYNTQIALIHTCSTQVGKEFGKSWENSLKCKANEKSNYDTEDTSVIEPIRQLMKPKR